MPSRFVQWGMGEGSISCGLIIIQFYLFYTLQGTQRHFIALPGPESDNDDKIKYGNSN